MYVYMYVYIYVNIFTDTRIHCRAGPAVGCISQLLLQWRTKACSFTALIGLTAAIHIHCCTGQAAVCRGHCRADPAVEVRSNGRVSFYLLIFAAFAVPAQRLFFAAIVSTV
jgi:hypothetical protein